MLIYQRIQQRCKFQKTHQLIRYRNIYNSAKLINFASNDYLGLSQHPHVKAAAIKAANCYGVGATASAVVCGYTREQHLLEQQLAEFMQRDACMLFANGYSANYAVLTTLFEKQDILFLDHEAHASLIEGALASRACYKRYRHLSAEHLEQLLKQYASPVSAIITESIFSLTGKQASLLKLAKLAQHYTSLLYVDEAHGFGICGSQGQGLVAASGLTQNQVPLVMVGLGKAMGGFGGALVGNKDLINYLQQFARAGIYSTALPPMVVAANVASLEVMQREYWRREYLSEITGYFKSTAQRLGLALIQSDMPIQAILCPDVSRALQLSEYLYQHGLLVYAMRPPTVAPHATSMRISLSVHHTKHDIKRLLTMIANFLQNFHVAA